ncbi:MAG: tetratricopeptide repeat protein [Spirochaetaceae bacterium]|jgi:tetratricopeptide (TPR) repeat protein|nr:tetratricopeptide repeat protein [Spirochaetaceae bacterium]
MKLDNALTKSLRYARAGRYSKAVSLLVPNILQYRDSWLFYYTLALASLHAGDTGSAREYIKSAYDIKENETNVLLLLALLNVKRGETSRAINYYLRVLESEPKNKIAARALAVLKKYGASGALSDWAASSRIKRLFPPFPRPPARRAALPVIAAAAGAVALCGALYLTFGWPPAQPGRARPPRAGYAQSALEASERARALAESGVWRYVLSEREVFAAYDKARALFNDHRDDAARREINRILLSNAADGIKNKARLLAGYLEPGDFATLKDNYTYSDVFADPPLYDGCTVRWKGVAANIVAEAATTRFDLLVGYDTRRNIEGLAPVVFASAQNISAERPLEVLARVAATGTAFTLEGMAIHQSARPQAGP